MAHPSSSTGASVPMFGNGWDDRELVNAYDAALLEFHIHHPGPGSWLDKATAALAKGQPLPGANAFDTAWYSAAKKGEEEQANPRKRQRTEPKPKKPSPYGTSGETAGRAASPTYQPPSPGVNGGEENVGENAGVEDEEEAGEGDFDEPEVYWGPEAPADDQDPAESGAYGDDGQVFPPPSGSWPGSASVSQDEAVGYALNAQYWAGYWMGVARGAQQGQAQAQPPAKKSRSQSVANGLRR